MNDRRSGSGEDLARLVDENQSAGLFRLHRTAFTDPHVFELEKERVFNGCWNFIAHESMLGPGNFITRRVAGRDVILVRRDDGQLSALINACRHRGSRVCQESSGRAAAFHCPYHGWSYNTRGELVGLPDEEGFAGSGFKRADFTLHRLRVASYRGFVFIHADPEAEPLTDFLAGAKEFIDLAVDQAGPAGLEVIGIQEYGIRTNWKLASENSVDNYHFRIMHRRYADFLRTKGTPEPLPHPITPRAFSFGNGHGGHESADRAAFGRLSGHWGPLLPEAAKPLVEANHRQLEATFGADRAGRITEATRNLRLYPNLCLIDHHMTFVRLHAATAVDYTEMTEWALAPKDEHPELRTARMRIHSGMPGPAGLVNPDDIEILELCQRGVGHRELEWLDYSRGMKRKPLAVDDLQHRAFYRAWHEKMTQGAVHYPIAN